jgi:hypothetical protein
MEDSTNVNEFENPGMNGNSSSQTFKKFCIRSRFKITGPSIINTRREKLERNTTG